MGSGMPSPHVRGLAKITRPTLAGTLGRPRLLRRLDRTRRRPVTWVCAPPGAGKTTLIASYLAARRQRVLWYEVDEGDGDVATFFYYLGLAAPRRRRPMPLLRPEYRQGLSVFARRFFRELFGRLGGPFTLVLDNYQEVPSDAAIHEVMRDALEEIPERGRLIFISRGDPPPTFARALANEMVDVLGWPELRFTAAEAMALVHKRAPGSWPRVTLRSLYDTTEGWCAGLILLLDQLKSQGGGLAGVRQPSLEVLFDYFASEIFKRTDPDVQEVLLQTAFLPQITAPMAEALTGRPTSGQMIATLHAKNYFTNKQAGTPPTYTYHPIFRAFLLSRAERAYSRDDRARICRSAAGLLDEQGQVEAAARLLREAEDWDALTLLIYRNAQSLVAQGRAQTLEEWLTGIPPAIFAEQPWLLFWRGMGRMAWQHAECQHALEQAFVGFRDRSDPIGTFLAAAGVIFSLVSEGRVAPMDRWLGLLEEIIDQTPAFPSKGVETRVATAMLAAIMSRQPQHPHGGRWAERAIELARTHPDTATRSMAMMSWITYQAQVGDLAKAATAVDEMRGVMLARDASPVDAVNAGIAVAWYEAMTAQPEYRRTVARMLALAQTTGMFYSVKDFGLCAGLQGALSDGDLKTAAPWLEELGRDGHLHGPMFRFWHQRGVVWQALVQHDVRRAVSHQPEMLRQAFLDGYPLDEVVARLMSAQVLLARGERDEPRAHVERALEIGRRIGSPYFEFMARLTEAQLELDAGRESDARRALAIAMARGRERGYATSHVWIPAVMARLCAHALDAGIETEYVRGLVQKRGLVPEHPPVEIEAWPWPIKIYTLGRFEVRRDDVPVSFPRKVQRKPLALLKTLLASGGRAVREDHVLDALWPESEGDAARLALNSAVHRLRALLRHDGALLRQDGALSLDQRVCWVDAWAVERLLGSSDTAAVREDDVRRATDLYRGPFLGDDQSELAQTSARTDGLRRRLLRHIVGVARRHEQANAEEAADWYEEGLRVDPCAEDVSRSLMRVYQQLGRRASVRAVYERCRTAVADRLGGTPSTETERLFRTLSSD